MKRIVAFILLTHSLSILTVPAGFIINRTGQAITVNFMNGANPLFTTGAISLSSDANHTSDQMVIIPLNTIENPQSTTTPKEKYKNSATSATITIGTATLTLPSFAANTSYVIAPVIAPGTPAGTFGASAGTNYTYDSITGAASTTNPAVTPGSGF